MIHPPSLYTQVVILEKNKETGRKILISGGTRCNVLPSQVDLDRDYFTDSSRSALRAVFSTWTLGECRVWLEKELGIALELEEETGKLFPASNSAADVRDALLRACQQRGVTVRYVCAVGGGDGAGVWVVGSLCVVGVGVLLFGWVFACVDEHNMI